MSLFPAVEVARQLVWVQGNLWDTGLQRWALGWRLDWFSLPQSCFAPLSSVRLGLGPSVAQHLVLDASPLPGRTSQVAEGPKWAFPGTSYRFSSVLVRISGQ